MKNKEAVFFCAAARGIEEKYKQAAREFVRAACLSGYDIVSGGVNKGLMDVVCREASDCGVGVRGVLPRFMRGLENPCLTELEWTDTMSERKEAMRRGTSLAVALAGGIGTLDELAETMCLSRLKQYSGRVIIVNQEGFYDNFKALMEDYKRTGMYEEGELSNVFFVSTVEEFTKLI